MIGSFQSSNRFNKATKCPEVFTTPDCLSSAGVYVQLDVWPFDPIYSTVMPSSQMSVQPTIHKVSLAAVDVVFVFIYQKFAEYVCGCVQHAHASLFCRLIWLHASLHVIALCSVLLAL